MAQVLMELECVTVENNRCNLSFCEEDQAILRTWALFVALEHVVPKGLDLVHVPAFTINWNTCE